MIRQKMKYSDADTSEVSIPKGLRHSAQGCEERATLGLRQDQGINPNGVATRGITSEPQPRWGWVPLVRHTQGSSAASQPWALGQNPFGIQTHNSFSLARCGLRLSRIFIHLLLPLILAASLSIGCNKQPSGDGSAK